MHDELRITASFPRRPATTQRISPTSARQNRRSFPAHHRHGSNRPPRRVGRECYRAEVTPDAMTPRRIHVSAAVITDAEGRLLVVRKAGTTAFMQPGGKPDPGETPAETLARELAEEIGVRVSPDTLEPLGSFTASAANEPGFEVVAEVFRVDIGDQQPVPDAEIAELRWVTAATASGLEIAPLARDYFLPA